MSLEWEAVARDWQPRERETILTAAMKHLTGCLRDVVMPPQRGASLTGILNAAEFDSVLKKHGLAIVPRQPTLAMREAWQKGLFRDFEKRYRAMLSATVER
jgi:hypothetical protein